MTAKKTEIYGIVKVKEGVLINEDVDGLKKYKKNRMRYRKMQSIQREIETVKNEMADIKALLSVLVSKL